MVARVCAGVIVLCALLTEPASAQVVVNEIHYHPPEGSGLEFVELYNAGATARALGGFRFTAGLDYQFPAGASIAGNGFVVVAHDPEALAARFAGIAPNALFGGFTTSLANEGERITLADASNATMDSLEFDDRFPWDPGADGSGPSLERVCASAPPDLPGNWRAGGPSPGRANGLLQCPPPEPPPPPVVLNEIFYHPENDAPGREFVELRNNTDQTVDLSGWSFGTGIHFAFPPGTAISPQGFLVVAQNAAQLKAEHGIQNVVGDFTGQLDNGGERLTLLDAAGAERDGLSYDDEGDWPAAADGLGRSLEKVTPTASGADPASWRASRSSASGSSWQDLTVTGTATSSRLYIHLDGAGECLIDDLRIEDPAAPGTNFIPNGEFVANAAGWTFAGNHSDSRWQPNGGTADSGALRLISRGVGGSATNSANRFTTPDLVSGKQYRLSLRLKFISGTASLTARLSGSGLLGQVRGSLISPGTENSVYAPALPPFVSGASRNPMSPRSTEAVTITARVRGQGIRRVTLHHNAGGSFADELMQDDGLSGDGVAGDGIYGRRLLARPHNTLVRYQILAEDLSGAVTVLPPEGDPSVEMAYYVDNDRPVTPLEVYQILINNLNGLSCTVYSTGTFVAGGEVYLNVGVRNRGQTTCGQAKRNIKVRFNHGRHFRGQQKINLNSMYPDKSVVREKLMWDLFRDFGYPYCSVNHVRVHNNGSYYGLFIDLEHPDEHLLARNGLDPSGNLYKAVASVEQKQSSIAGYMAAYEKKTNEDDDFSDLAQFLDSLTDTPDSGLMAFLQKNVNPEAMVDYVASASAPMNVDHLHKNHYLYHDPVSGRWQALIWDLDLSYGRIFDGANGGVYNDTIQTNASAIMGHPSNVLIDRFFLARSPLTPVGSGYYKRAYYGRLWDMVEEKFTLPRQAGKVDELRLLLGGPNAQAGEQALDIAKWGRFTPRPDPTHPPDFDFNTNEIKSKFLAQRIAYLRSFLTTARYTGHPRVKITEIHYHPALGSESLEFVELWNSESAAVPIARWYLGAIDYEFPSGTTLAAGEVVVVAKDPATFASVYTIPQRVFGPYPGDLANEGETLRLQDARPAAAPPYPAYYPTTIDVVTYTDRTPWPTTPDGEGPSLELIDPRSDNDFAESWAASSRPGGSPGVLSSAEDPFRRGDADQSGSIAMVDALAVLNYIFRNGAAPSCPDAADANDDGLIDISDALGILLHLFSGGGGLPAPGPATCGPDPTLDGLLGCVYRC